MEHLAALETEIRGAVARAAAQAPPPLTLIAYHEYAESGDRQGYERPYFERRGRLAAAAAAALLDRQRGVEPDEEVLRLLVGEVRAVCDEWTWAVPAHASHARDGDMYRCIDLFAAETAHTLSEIAALFGHLLELLEPGITTRIRAEVLNRVLIPFADDRRPIGWESFENNWLAVCAGAVGMAALAVLRDDSERLSRVLNRSLASIHRFLAAFGDDGGCVEGVGYWAYGFGYFVYFAEVLREFDGTDLLDDAKVRRIAAFPARVGFGGGFYPAFSDGSEDAFIPAGLASRLTDRLGTPVPAIPTVAAFTADPAHRWGHLSRDILWSGAAVLGRPAEPSSVLLADLGWVVDRDGDLAFAAKGGHNGEPHNHLDLGHFVLHAAGETLLADLGSGPYTRDYFDDVLRYSILQPSAEGHSVPLIDGRGQLPGTARRAEVLHYRADDFGTDFDLDLTAAYDVPFLRGLRRSFAWRRAGLLTLVDEIDTGRVTALEELFISRRRPDVLADGSVVWMSQGGATVRLEPVPDFTPVVETIGTVDHRGAPDTVHRLRLRGITAAGISRHTFRFTLRMNERSA